MADAFTCTHSNYGGSGQLKDSEIKKKGLKRLYSAFPRCLYFLLCRERCF